MTMLSEPERKRYIEIGEAIGLGLLRIGAISAFCVVLAGYVLGKLFNHDDCDQSFWIQCGMTVVTDAKTGQQYLLSPHGGIIQRAEKP